MILENQFATYNLNSNNKIKKYYYADSGILAYNNNGYLLKYFEEKNSIKSGIDFTSIDAGNYYHFIFEIICKFYYLKSDLYSDIPLLVDRVILEKKQ